MGTLRVLRGCRGREPESLERSKPHRRPRYSERLLDGGGRGLTTSAASHEPMNSRSTDRRVLAALSCAALAALGCTADWNEQRADDMARRALDNSQAMVLDRRAADVRQPELLPPPPVEEDVESTGETDPDEPAVNTSSGSSPAPGPASTAEPLLLDLERALSLAVAGNRDYRTQLESVYLQAVSLVGTRNRFSPQMTAVLSYLFADASGIEPTQDVNASFSLSQILPSGGTIFFDAGTSYAELTGGLRDVFGSRAGVRFVQPLLRGGGRLVAFESLVQGERNLMYALRDFELFRQDFSIDVARQFYDLVQQKQALENQRKNLDAFEFARRQAEALFNVGRTRELDVLRARRSELNSYDDFLTAQEALRLARDRFRIFLGLPPEQPVDVVQEAPEFVEVRYAVGSAVEVALENRLDVLNRRGRLQDAERAVRIARNGLLPDLDLTLNYDRTSSGDPSLLDQELDLEAYSAGLTLGLPVNRVQERNSYRSAQIAFQREARGFEQFLDSLQVDVVAAFRALQRRFQSLEIQRELIRDQQKNLRIAQIRFEQGVVSNRDVVEAQDSLLQAQNALIREQVQYEIARLNLLRDLGILFIDEQGMWREGTERR